MKDILNDFAIVILGAGAAALPFLLSELLVQMAERVWPS
jgi:hypothetical protein